jgi:hypothetical protein
VSGCTALSNHEFIRLPFATLSGVKISQRYKSD